MRLVRRDAALGSVKWLAASLRPASHSDLFLLPDAVQLAVGEDWVGVLCRDNPDFVFGNYLILRSAPTQADLPRHLSEWASVFRDGGVRKVALQWEDGSETAGVNASGWTLDRSVVLARGLPVQRDTGRGTGSAVRAVSLRADADRVLALLEEGLAPDSGGPAFLRWRLGEYASLIDSGRGQWLGAWEGGELVATCGVFDCGGLLRLQLLVTAPTARRRGHATALCRTALGLRWGGRRLPAVAVAEPGGGAEQLYRGLGFETIGWQLAVLAGKPC
jgi:GNAT superfamily N-acetyltransferase